MLARDAESLFWTGRYLERAEDTARLLDVTYHGLLETTPAEEADGLARRARRRAPRRGVRRAPSGPLDGHVGVGVPRARPDNSGSILSAVEQARENARTVREQLSTELWESLNSFCLELRARNLRADLEFQPHELYGMVRRQCQTVAGVAAETMARDEGWRFFVLGWNLERAEMTCRLLVGALPPAVARRRSTSGWARCGRRRRSRPTAAPTAPRWTRSTWSSSCCCRAPSPAACCSRCARPRTRLARLAPDGELTRPLRQLGRVRVRPRVRRRPRADAGRPRRRAARRRGGHPPGGRRRWPRSTSPTPTSSTCTACS